MSLRVISGTAKGRRLKSVPGDTTRPITDRAKEALFDLLATDVVDSAWWDMFGGTVAVGIEALSRGPSFVRFPDLNRAPIDTIKAKLQATRLASRAEAKRADAFALLSTRPDRQFHYVYIAPPQYQEMWSRALSALDDNPTWLTDDGCAIVQIAPKEYRNLELKALAEFEQRKYGSTLMIFYEKK